MTREMKEDYNSMLYWWPRVCHLKTIPMPKTWVYKFPKEEADNIWQALDGNNRKPVVNEKIRVIARKAGYPLFMRTDQASGKHDWEDTCFVQHEEDLHSHIMSLIEWNLCADIIGLPWRALVFREYIAMQSAFTAFRGFPVAPERRYFVQDGEVICHHPYWIEDAIADSGMPPSRVDWQLMLKILNFESYPELRILRDYAGILASLLPGAWSIDFCKASDERWIFIDAALAKDSWHPEDCPHAKELKKGG